MLPSIVFRPTKLMRAEIFCAVIAVAAVLLLPLAARSSYPDLVHAGARGTAMHVTLPATVTPWRPVVVTRDPFLYEPDSPPTALPAHPSIATHPVPVQSTVRAVVVGAQARALVEGAGGLRVIRIGDVVDGATVRMIRADGVWLSNGLVLVLASEP